MARYKDIELLDVVAWESDNEDFDKGVNFVLEKIDSLPTADYEKVKHARWKGVGMGDYECTSCWEVFSGGNRFKRCPNCGAIMDAMSLSEVLTGSGRSEPK